MSNANWSARKRKDYELTSVISRDKTRQRRQVIEDFELAIAYLFSWRSMRIVRLSAGHESSLPSAPRAKCNM